MKFRVDVEEVPEEVEAKDMAEALQKVVDNVGIYPMED